MVFRSRPAGPCSSTQQSNSLACLNPQSFLLCSSQLPSLLPHTPHPADPQPRALCSALLLFSSLEAELGVFMFHCAPRTRLVSSCFTGLASGPLPSQSPLVYSRSVLLPCKVLALLLAASSQPSRPQTGCCPFPSGGADASLPPALMPCTHSRPQGVSMSPPCPLLPTAQL